MRRWIFLFILFLLTFIISTRDLAAIINPPNLTVNKTGTGTGTVTSNPAGINCGVDCTEFYPPSTLVSLTATEDTGSTFTGWGGDCSSCGTSATCDITMDDDKYCAATFMLNSYTLTINKAGIGTGTVTSSPSGIDCGSDCTETYNSGTVVTLTASAHLGSVFAGWSGDSDCSDGQVTLDASKACTATFNLNRPVTIPTATGQGNITLDTGSTGCGFYNVSAKTEAEVGNDPSNDYLYGLLEFSLSCSVADVTLTYSGATDLTDYTYRKHGPTTPGNPATIAWYTFNANITGNTVTLHLEDGQLGDDTGVDGVIVDQGGPGQPPQQVQPVGVPTMTEWGMIIFMVLAGIGAVVYLTRKMQLK